MISIQNKQHYIAEQFFAKDILLIKANYEATLKIKRWKFIHNLDVLSKNIRKEADNMIQSSFLSFIDNDELLLIEGFFDSPVEN